MTITSSVPGVSTLTITFKAFESIVNETGVEEENVIVEQTFEYITEWWAGSITLPKSVAFGKATIDPFPVCYTLTRTDGTLVTTSKSPQCLSIESGNPDHTFEWEGLTAGTYQLVEQVNGNTYAFIQPITGIVVDSAHPDVQLPSMLNRLEGCSPGYWKNHIRPEWEAAGLDPDDLFNNVFDFINSPIASQYPDDFNLEQAINSTGGEFGKLARHGLAALLNARHPDVLFPLEQDGIEGSVIDLVQQAMVTIDGEPLSSELASANVLGCPIN